jgi:hypothetical protein
MEHHRIPMSHNKAGAYMSPRMFENIHKEAEKEWGGYRVVPRVTETGRWKNKVMY